MSVPTSFENQNIWHDLGEKEKIAIKSAMRRRRVARGETLIEKGLRSDTFYIVNFGLFEVRNAANTQTVAEIGADQLIGEIGFFARVSRTAAVVAARDSEVLEIDRPAFDNLVARCPEVQRAFSQSLAKRLAQFATIVGGSESVSPKNHMRVMAVIATGSEGMPKAFVDKLRKVTIFHERLRLLNSSDAKNHFGTEDIDREAATNWIADIERDHDLVICFADDDLSVWTQIIMRSADQLMIIAHGQAGNLNSVENLAYEIFPPARRRLVRLHMRRSGASESTAPWLRQRDVFMVHHLALDDEEDFHSLRRFIAGRAIGFVAGAGGAFGPAHVGIFRAFRESGIAFDIFGGSSVGSAMAATFSLLMKPDEVDAGIHEVFVRRRAFKKLTLPRYGLLDHTVLDHALQEQFGSTAIEDVWKPYFAVATDLSTYSMRIIRTGLLWQAIRASCAMPGVLPPFFYDDGHMLVDGGVADNVPTAAMKSLKNGPNLVVDLRPLNRRIYDVHYQSLPGRWPLLAQFANPFTRQKLPRCPAPASVIQRSIFANFQSKPVDNNSHDLVLRPPKFPGSSFMNWDRHRDVVAAAYQWGLKTVDKLRAEGNPAFAAMERYSNKISSGAAA